MNHIKAVSGLSPHMGSLEPLFIFMDGKRLDEILSQEVKEDNRGLIPAWPDFYDEAFMPSVKEKEYVWRQTQLSDKPAVLPLLLCPDDFDFSCTVIAVEAVCVEKTVIWRRFGIDITPFDAGETVLPPYIEKKAEWFHNVGPFVFSKAEYLCCISQFSGAGS